MKLIAQQPQSHRRFVIERGENVGYYLYVVEKEKCVFDYLQDTLELAIEQALWQFDIPKNVVAEY